MTYLEKLLKGTEVEWATLSEVFELKNGYTPSKANIEYWTNGKIPWFRLEDIRQNGRVLNDSIQHISSSAVKGNKLFPANSIIISTSATIGEHALISVPFLSNQRFTSLSLKVLYKEKFNIKFLFHYSFLLGEWCRKNTTIGNFAGVDMSGFKNIPIPIPPLEIQQKIVDILDKFTELTADLTAELTARKQQYAYYLERLLAVESGNINWKEISELTISTNNVRWGDNKNTYRYIDLSSVSRENNSIIETSIITSKTAPSRAQKIILEDDVIFATTRPTQLRLCLITEEYSGQIASTGYCVLRAKEGLVNPKWIFFNLTTKRFKNFVEENQSGAAYPSISDSKLKEFKIPVPSISEQERIISLLDKFETLTTSISEGLPKEIELRKKQYEYYRDMLLSFPKKES